MCGGETEAETWQAKKTKRKATAHQGVTLTGEERESRQKRECNGNRRNRTKCAKEERWKERDGGNNKGKNISAGRGMQKDSDSALRCDAGKSRETSFEKRKRYRPGTV